MRVLSGSEEKSMHPAGNVQFERTVREFARWRAVPEQDRSAAPAWWWGPAFELLGVQQPMPADWCARLELPNGSTLGDGAKVLLKYLADQASLPWAGDFPGRVRHPDQA
jgi:hypothetical protein